MIDEENKNAQEPAPSPANETDQKQYTPTIEQANTVVVGEHNVIGLSYKDMRDIADDRIKTTLTEVLHSDDIRGMFKREAAAMLNDLQQSDDYLGTSPPSTSGDAEELPADLEKWFYGLSAEKQYTVQAIVILHGGKTYDISQAREQLISKAHENTLPATLSSSGDTSAASPLHIPRLQASSELYGGTYTEFRTVYGTERIFFRDTTVQGNSPFRIRLLHFLSREAMRGSWGVSGQYMLVIAEAWAESTRGDSYWRAAQALGIIWSQDPERLKRIANDWANSKTQRDWRRAASLLYGAYEFEQILGDEFGLQRSRIPGILKQWIERAHTYGNYRVGCAAAYAYGLLARRSPETALQGLDDLLNFSLRPDQPANQQGIPLTVFVALTSNYVNLVWLGHLRLLIQHIATRIEELVQKRTRVTRLTEQAQHKFQRTIVLETLFTVFFLVAGESLPDTSTSPSTTSLSAPLQEPPQIPATDGRDTLLVGLLTKDPAGWRREIAVIVCGAIIEHKSQLTFDFLQNWTLQVLEEQSEEQKKSYRSLVRFFTEIDVLLIEWTQGLVDAGFSQQTARETFWRRFYSWQKKSPALKTFVEDVRALREKQIQTGR